MRSSKLIRFLSRIVQVFIAVGLSGFFVLSVSPPIIKRFLLKERLFTISPCSIFLSPLANSCQSTLKTSFRITVAELLVESPRTSYF
jgi:hypothetical protein